jgi:hypothetical protein
MHKHAVPDAAGDEGNRERTARSGKRRRKHGASRKQKHSAGEILAKMVHLPRERDRCAEDDRADGGGKVGQNEAIALRKPSAARIGAQDAGDEDQKAQRPRNLGPIRSNKGDKGGGDQQPADDCHRGRNGHPFRYCLKRGADGVASR